VRGRVPKTIDNDLDATVMTFGYAPARGRRRGDEIVGGADAILISEIPYDLTRVAAHLERRGTGRRSYTIVVVAEGAHPAGGDVVAKHREAGPAHRAPRRTAFGPRGATWQDGELRQGYCLEANGYAALGLAEGVQLLAVYVILGLAFFFAPGTPVR
jgi:6-phosphofructokinase